MEAKPVELLFLPSPDDYQPPKKLKSTLPCTTPSGHKSNHDQRPAYTSPGHHGLKLSLRRSDLPRALGKHPTEPFTSFSVFACHVVVMCNLAFVPHLFFSRSLPPCCRLSRCATVVLSSSSSAASCLARYRATRLRTRMRPRPAPPSARTGVARDRSRRYRHAAPHRPMSSPPGPWLRQ
jgi:hypothetical protein